MWGVELIAKERVEQLVKHDWTLFHDRLENAQGQLMHGAIYALTMDEHYWPENWNTDFKAKLDEKPMLDQLIIAGALIAAEIDRIQGDQKQESHV